MLFETPNLNAEEQAVVARIDELRQSLANRVSRSRQWVGLLRRSLFARAIRGSNSIEGHRVTVDDAMAAVEEERPLEAEGVTWAAVIAYRNAMTYVLQTADAPMFGAYYGMHLFSALHFMIMSYDTTKRPGAFRTGPIYVRRDGSEIIYEGPDADTVLNLTGELCTQLNDEKKGEIPPKVRAAMCHLNLVMIHPFMDGNGRLARCFQSLILAREGFTASEFCSIEEWLGRNTPEYYNVLAEVGGKRWSPSNNARPWIRFCLKGHFQQAQTVLRRAKLGEALWGELEALVHRLGLPERMIAALFNASIGFTVRNSSYRKDASVSQNVAGYDLKALTAQHLLVALGAAGGRIYEASDTLKAMWGLISRSVPNIIEDPFATATVEAISSASIG